MAADEHPTDRHARVLLPAAGAAGLVGYGALYLAALAFYAPFGAVPEDAGLSQAVLLVRLVVLVSIVAVLVLLLLALVALVVAVLDGVRRLAGRPRLDLARTPGRRTVALAVAVLAGVLGSAPWTDGSWVVEAVVVVVLVLAATWLAARVSGGVRRPAAVLALATWAAASFGLVNLGDAQARQVRESGTWDEDVTLLGVYPGYAYLGLEYGPSGTAVTPATGTAVAPATGPGEPYVSLGDAGGVFVLVSCRDGRTVRVSTAAVSVSVVGEDAAQLDAARSRCAALIAGR